MKTVNLFLVLVLCLALFSACKKEDEKETTPKENLVNKTWVVTDSKTKIELPLGQTLPDSIQDAYDPTQQLKGQIITFKEDGTFQVGTDATQQGNWSLSEDGKKITFTGLVEGNLTQIIDAQTLVKLQTFDVTTLTDAKLAIQNSTPVPLSAEITKELTGFPLAITVTVNLNITFDKQ